MSRRNAAICAASARIDSMTCMANSRSGAVYPGEPGGAAPATHVPTRHRSSAVCHHFAMPATLVRAACPHDCPDTCAMLVTVEDGRAVKVHGHPDHPPTRGVLCTKVSRYTERTYHAERVLQPLRRVGP